jgi:predicted PurR-regulated permease PerM
MANQIVSSGPRVEAVPRLLPEPARLSLPVFALRVAVAVLVAVVILLVVYLLWLSVRILLEAFAGVLFAVFLTTLSGWVSRTMKLSHGWALAIVVAALLLLASGLGWLMASRVMSEAVQLKQTLPKSLEQVRSLLANTAWGHYLLELFPETPGWLGRPETVSQVTGLVSGVAGFLVALLVICFVGLFGAAEPEVYRAGLLHLIPPSYRRRAGQALDTVADNLRWWLAGQVALMVAIGVVTGAGLWLLGIPLALSLGLVAGLLEMMPYLGPWLSVIPAALVAFLVGPWHVLMVLGLYLGVHILEGYVLGPLVQRRAVRLPPALTLLAQVLLGS